MEFNIEIEEMTDKQATLQLCRVLTSLIEITKINQELSKEVLEAIKEPIEDLECEDFFGTEGLLRD